MYCNCKIPFVVYRQNSVICDNCGKPPARPIFRKVRNVPLAKPIVPEYEISIIMDSEVNKEKIKAYAEANHCTAELVDKDLNEWRFKTNDVCNLFLLGTAYPKFKEES